MKSASFLVKYTSRETRGNGTELSGGGAARGEGMAELQRVVGMEWTAQVSRHSPECWSTTLR